VIFWLPYDAPPWTKGLKGVPSHKVELAQCNTPIQRWNLPGVPDDFEIFIKRDDLTGSVLSGNKVRKLEFLFADAIKQGCSSIITCGGTQSNFCRATCICAKTLGMKAHLLLKTDKDPADVPCAGNYLLDHMVGAHVYFLPTNLGLHEDVWPRMRQLADTIEKETGKKAYTTPPGGSTSVGMFGYVNAFHEMTKQDAFESITDVVSATGSGGTAAGLIVGNHLTGNKVKLHGMVVSDTGPFHHNEVNQMLRDVELQKADGSGLTSEDSINLLDGPIGAGYALSSQDELEFIRDVAQHTGIILDPVYTGKSVFHLVKQLQTNPGMFKGKKIIFLHTGGMFALFDGRMQDVFAEASQKVTVWKEFTDKAPLKV
ncbi:uncharacterized protein, partial [Amphiura filiformis]|uniref:uncharacterized protein n=1 Tax=Amphiura filiformis TaxID=82378 RepID=UPI003B225CD1